jgi:Holliday junction DNA helicase RuvA
MIGRLQGRLLDKQPPWLLLDVNGVGYEVEAPMSTFYTLPAVGEPVTLLTHLVVRDDAHLLFGFAERQERELFRDLVKVSGVGAKLALTILSGIAVSDFIAAVRSGESERLTQLPGVGKKTAARLVMEMRDRYAATEPVETGIAAPGEAGAPEQPGREAHRALVALGYKPQEATRLLRGVEQPGLGSEELIRLALKGAVK